MISNPIDLYVSKYLLGRSVSANWGDSVKQIDLPHPGGPGGLLGLFRATQTFLAKIPTPRLLTLAFVYGKLYLFV